MDEQRKTSLARLPLLSLLLGVMPKTVSMVQLKRFDKVRGNMEFAAWINRENWAETRRMLINLGFTWWIECGENTVWCYGAGWIEDGEKGTIWSLIWETIENGQKARVLFHGRDGSHQLMVISKSDFLQKQSRRMKQ